MRYITLLTYDPALSPWGLERLYSRGDTSGVSAQHVKRLRAVLAALATASVPSDMALPGARLHPLRGDRAGQWSVSISGNWRVIFEFEGQHVTNVDLGDYQ
jgi:proteic killer suppression protein